MWVKATKPEPPIPLPVEEVSVEVWRQSRAELSDASRAATAVDAARRRARGARRCDAAWNAPSGPNGGYLAAIVLRALTAEVDDAGARGALADLPLPAPARRRRRCDVDGRRSSAPGAR